MSLKNSKLPSIPSETKRVAKASFPKGNLYIDLQKHIGPLFENDDFIEFYPKKGRPTLAPWRLALVSIFQYIESLSDRQAADSVRARIDWKYILRLNLDDSGFDHTALTKFRKRLLEHKKETMLFEIVLKKLIELGVVEEEDNQRTDSTHIFAMIRELNRIECVGESIRSVLNSVAIVDIEWLKFHIPRDWFERYEHTFSEYHLPKSREEQIELATQIGKDGFQLLSWLDSGEEKDYFSKIPAVKTLRKVLEQNYEKKKML